MAGNSSSSGGDGIESHDNYDKHTIHARNDGSDGNNEEGSSSSENDWQFQRKRKRTTIVKTRKAPEKKIPGTSTMQLVASHSDSDGNDESKFDDGIKVGTSNTSKKQQIPHGSNRAPYNTIQKRVKSKKRRRRLPIIHNNDIGNPSDATLQNHYVALFQDDQTGCQYVHPSALRFALKLIKEEAHKTTESISLSLFENGEIDESRKVQLRSSDHVRNIISKIRSHLSNIMIPARYVRIEDLNLTDLQLTNAQRQHEIDDYRTLVKQLEKQHSILESEYNEAKANRDDLQNQLKSLTEANRNDITKTTTTPIHPILLNQTMEADQNAFPKYSDLVNSYNGTQTVASAPKDTMSSFLKDLESPYD